MGYFDDLIPNNGASQAGAPQKLPYGPVQDPNNPFGDLVPGGMSTLNGKASVAAQGALPNPDTGNNNHGWSGIGSALMGGAQGLTFGFGDEIGGAGKWIGNRLTGGNESLGDSINDVRQQFKNAQSDNPTAYGTGDVAGSVASALIPGVGEVGNLGRGAEALGGASRLLNAIKGGAITGAAAGGLRGIGDGEGLTNSLEGGLTGAIGGAALGAGLPALGGAVRGVGNVAQGAIDNLAQAGSNAVGALQSTPLVNQILGRKLKSGIVSPLIDNAVDKTTDYLSQQGPLAQKLAAGIGDTYQNSVGGSQGLLAREAGSLMFPHLIPTELAARGGAGLAQGAGALAQTGPVINAAAQQVGSMDAQQSQLPADGPQDANDDQAIMARAANTQWAQAIQQAQAQGPQSLRTTLYVLKRNPAFRKAVGLDLSQ